MEKIQTQGVAIPRLGFGTFRMPGGGCQPVVESALGLGFRHIDTAAMYENEDAVGAAIASSGVKREDLFDGLAHHLHLDREARTNWRD